MTEHTMYATKKNSRQSLINPQRGSGNAVHSRNLSIHYQRQPTAFFEPIECTYKSRQFSYKRRSQVSLRRKNRFKF